MAAAQVVRRSPPYEITLTRDRRFVFDWDDKSSSYRVAWYERRRVACAVCKGTGFPDGRAGLCKECHGRRFTWPMVRTVGRDRELADAISAARGEKAMTLDSSLLADYVFSTEWGRELPGARPYPGLDASLLASHSETQKYERDLYEKEYGP